MEKIPTDDPQRRAEDAYLRRFGTGDFARRVTFGYGRPAVDAGVLVFINTVRL